MLLPAQRLTFFSSKQKAESLPEGTCGQKRREGPRFGDPPFLVRGHFQAMRNFGTKIGTVLCTARFLFQNLSRLQMATGRGVRRATRRAYCRPPQAATSRGVGGPPHGSGRRPPIQGKLGAEPPDFRTSIYLIFSWARAIRAALTC